MTGSAGLGFEGF